MVIGLQLSCLIARVQDLIDHLGDLDVLDRDSCQVRHRYLVLAGSTDFGVLDHVAQFKNGTLFDPVIFHRMKALTVIDTL